jgi:hypothetical protein
MFNHITASKYKPLADLVILRRVCGIRFRITKSIDVFQSVCERTRLFYAIPLPM